MATLNSDDSGIRYDPETGEPIEPERKPEPSQTPLEKTWEDSSSPAPDPDDTPTPRPKAVTVIICPETGLRATVNCPRAEARTFNKGREPRDFCSIHR
jgi:hypothetical protein